MGCRDDFIDLGAQGGQVGVLRVGASECVSGADEGLRLFREIGNVVADETSRDVVFSCVKEDLAETGLA